MKVVAWCVALSLGVLAAWLVVTRWRTSPVAAPIAATGGARSAATLGVQASLEADAVARKEREGLADESPAAESDSASSQHTLTVRSSIGLALPFIEWEAAENDWRREDLDHSRCEVASMNLPCRIRAPGHVASPAAKAGEEIVLEPDALLVLEATGLKVCLSAIRPYDDYATEPEDEASMGPELRRTIAWGWISDDRWALAATSDLAELAVGRGQPLSAMLRWRDGQTARIEFEAKAGVRGSWAPPCGQVIDAAPLDVHIVRPTGSGSGRLELRIRRPIEEPSSGREGTYPWGKVTILSRDDFWQNELVPASRQDAQFAGVPTGESLLLIARDEETNAYGRLSFVHDGSPRTLTLRSAFEVTGRLVSDVTSAPVAKTDVRWQFKEGEEDVGGWQAQALSLALDPDGRFVLRGPSQPLTSESWPLDPPARLFIHIAAPGFKPYERTCGTGGEHRFDCGEIRLIPVDGDIVLAPADGQSPKAIRWQRVMTSSTPGIWWNVRDAAPTNDGRLAIFLVRSEEHPDLLRTRENGQGNERAWPSVPPQRILIHVHLDDGDEPWAFERGSDACYHAVPRQEHTIEAECRALSGEGQSWLIGIQWHEVWDWVRVVPAQKLGQRVRLHFSTPAEDAILYWSAFGRPPRSEKERDGSIPMNGLTGTLVLE